MDASPFPFIHIYTCTDYLMIQLQIFQCISCTVGWQVICLVNGSMYGVLISVPTCLVASSIFKIYLLKKIKAYLMLITRTLFLRRGR